MKNKKYLLLYYFSFVITILFTGFATYKNLELLEIGDIGFISILSNMMQNIIFLINMVLVIVFTVLLLRKRKLVVDSLWLPIMYVCFFTIVLILSFLFNNKVMISYLHFEYYAFFINIGYLLLNGYSLLLIKYKIYE